VDRTRRGEFSHSGLRGLDLQGKQHIDHTLTALSTRKRR
jgi:hypothetical protein